jgi:hypothetical protein
VYFDLGGAEWNAVEIDASGWRVIDNPPVKFHRHTEIVALPLPQRGGSIDQLRALVNIKNGNFDLYLGALLDPLDPRPRTRPFVQIIGPEGYGKTSSLNVARNLLDPLPDGKARAMPEKVDDVFVNARNALFVTYDNVGKELPQGMSDTFCQVTSGIGLSKRKFYTNADEATLCVGARMFMVTSRGSVVTKPDLADRVVKISVEEIAPGCHLEESQFNAMLEQDRAQILDALFDRVSCGLGRMSEVRLSSKPRIADAACWATACEPIPGAFMRAYWESRHDAIADVVEREPVVIAIDAFTPRNGTKWVGTATELLRELANIIIPEKPTKWKDWPKNSGALGRHLTGVVATLRKIGIECTRDRATPSDRTRLIHLQRISPTPTPEGSEPTSPEPEPTGSVATGPADPGPTALVRGHRPRHSGA